jgi:zinc and cadmium transporter
VLVIIAGSLYYINMAPLIIYSLIGGVVSLVGGLALIWNHHAARKIITPLLAFAAGAFLGASFLDILPEALGMGVEPGHIMLAALAGFVVFFILERMIMVFRWKSDGHDHSDHTESLPFLVILGDSIHNFLDGIVIALAYIAHPILGLTTTFGVAAHEIPQEIGDFSILLNHGWSKKRIILVNILQSLLTIPGVIVGFYAGIYLEPYLPYLLGATAGTFIYIAASDLIPEIHHRAGHRHFYKVIVPLLASLAIIWYLIELAH